MRNQYRGVCYRCGGDVEPGQGHFERVNPKRMSALGIDKRYWIGRKWVIQHADCAIKHRGENVAHESFKEE